MFIFTANYNPAFYKFTMEHFFRTALLIFVLIGCLQAAPAPHMEDFRFDLLQDVACKGNVTFKSPKNVSGSCLSAVETIREGMEKAHEHCQCFHCGKVLEALDIFEVPSAVANSEGCRGETEGTLTFNVFVNKSKDVIEYINSKS